MQIVIDMNDSLYHRLKADKYKNNPEQAWADITDVVNAIHKGTPLSKGHGRLIDADRIITEATNKMKYPANHEYMECVIAHMKLAPTIIEADKENT